MKPEDLDQVCAEGHALDKFSELGKGITSQGFYFSDAHSSGQPLTVPWFEAGVQSTACGLPKMCFQTGPEQGQAEGAAELSWG